MLETEHLPQIDFDNTYHRDLEGFYVPWKGVTATAPKLIKLNQLLAEQLGIDLSSVNEQSLAAIFSGSRMLNGAAPLAQAYAGHQFGGFTPQLGDGRALLLGEIVDAKGVRYDIQLKGSGRTPFSRGGDGKAAIGPVLREYLISEAMHALGVPTTRSLAAVSTGDDVMRESILPGAVLTRVATSHLRVGTFQYFSARGETDKVKQLADYAIQRHYPHLVSQKDIYLQFLAAVRDAHAELVAKWMSIGFIHGVMNTDNTTISGETIDYGPCAFIDTYNPAAVFSSIDTHGRYAFQNQPTMAIWNVTRLAETLLPLIDEDEDKGVERATGVLNAFSDIYFANWLDLMQKKLGLTTNQPDDMKLVKSILDILERQNVDYTQFFSRLGSAVIGNVKCEALFNDTKELTSWIESWQKRIAADGVAKENTDALMTESNPIYIPRNHKVEEALEAATNDQDFNKFETLISVLQSPFEKRKGFEAFEGPAPESDVPYRTFCGT